ncbi:hypothetical protein GGR57DRAFT_492886 [Xylariaceae sp. FL1272]|nr:hypothetical protein GGR57DRAFT_492886 [Xylariaceae sp. FL1272]
MDTQDQSSQLSSRQGLLVIHAALFRMGVPESFAYAYRILGYKVHHGVESRRRRHTWPSISGPKQPFTGQNCGSLWGSKYNIVTDMASPFVPQLIEAYPNPKVVVVRRDYESWWESFIDVIVFFDWYINGVRAAYAMRKYYEIQEPLCAFLGKDIPNVPFARVDERKAHMDRILERQNETVRKTTRKVFVMDLGAPGHSSGDLV